MQSDQNTEPPASGSGGKHSALSLEGEALLRGATAALVGFGAREAFGTRATISRTIAPGVSPRRPTRVLAVASWAELLRACSTSWRMSVAEAGGAEAGQIYSLSLPGNVNMPVREWLAEVTKVLGDPKHRATGHIGVMDTLFTSAPDKIPPVDHAFLISVSDQGEGKAVADLLPPSNPITLTLSYRTDRFIAEFANILLEWWVHIFGQYLLAEDRLRSEIKLLPTRIRATDSLLDRRADQLARYLAGFGAGPGARIAVHLPQSLDLPVAWLAVLNNGAKLLHLDASLPEERIQATLREEPVSIIVTISRFARAHWESPAHVICLDSERRAWQGEDSIHGAPERPVHKQVKTPVFFVGRADVELLSRYLGEDYTVYAIPAGASGPEELAGSIEDIARRGLRAIMHRQASGPYHLAGHASGAVVAFEMARQLKMSGFAVGLLALIDTPEWNYSRNMLESLPLQQRFGLQYRGAWNRILLGRRRGRAVDAHLLEPRSLTAQKYRPQFYEGLIHLVLCSADRSPVRGADPMLGWGRLAADIVITHVPGRHDTLFTQPHVESLASALRRALQEMESGHSARHSVSRSEPQRLSAKAKAVW